MKKGTPLWKALLLEKRLPWRYKRIIRIPVNRFQIILDQLVYKVYLSPLLKKEYKEQIWKLNERPIEFNFLFKCLSKIYPKDILDVGTGKTALPHLMYNCGFDVMAIDEIDNYWKQNVFNRHYYIIKDDITKSKIKKKFDLINCMSALEHIPNHDLAIMNMCKMLKKRGYMVLTFPYNEKKYIKNAYKLSGAGYGQKYTTICQVFSRKNIKKWLEKNNCQIINQEYYQIFTGKYWTFGKRIYPPKKVNSSENHQLTCILIQKK